ncbi:MAG: hypothetical protein ACOH2E_05740 [Candidatus Paracaedibacter sp.]
MKKSPLILTLLGTSLIWSSPQQAMEGHDHIVLDKRLDPSGKPQILVLTATGRANAEALQRSYDEQQAKERALLSHEGFGEDPELAEAIRLSLENQTLGLTNPTSAATSEDPGLAEAIRLSLKDQTPTLIIPSTLPTAKEEGDQHLNYMLSVSAREYEEHQQKIDKEKETLEKKRLNRRRNEVRKALEEETDLRLAQKHSIFSKIDELIEKKKHINEGFAFLLKDSQSLETTLKINQLEEEDLKNINDQIINLSDEISSFREIDNLIHEEIIRLIRGEDPSELPWMQNLINFPQTEAGENSLFPPIPSSALPHFTSGELTKK